MTIAQLTTFTMSDNILYLHPRDPQALFDITRLTEGLRKIGFIDEPFDFRGQPHYKPGGEFLYLLTFLGCSPVVSLGEPGKTGDEFCHIEFTPVSEQTRFIVAENAKVPRCRHCNQRIEAWRALIEQWQRGGSSEYHCPHCGKTTALHCLKWKQCAGFGRQFLKVWGIFEGEAVPGEELMNALRQNTAMEWDYFYTRES